MRTTVTLEPDTRRLVERLMSERGLSFKGAVNEAIRRGLSPPRRTASPTKTARLGSPRVDLTSALAIAADLEDEALARRLADDR